MKLRKMKIDTFIMCLSLIKLLNGKEYEMYIKFIYKV